MRCLCLDLPNLGSAAEIFFMSLTLKKCSIQMMYMGITGHSLQKEQFGREFALMLRTTRGSRMGKACSIAHEYYTGIAKRAALRVEFHVVTAVCVCGFCIRGGAALLHNVAIC